MAVLLARPYTTTPRGARSRMAKAKKNQPVKGPERNRSNAGAVQPAAVESAGVAQLSEAEEALIAEYGRAMLAHGARRPPALIEKDDPSGRRLLTPDPHKDPDLF